MCSGVCWRLQIVNQPSNVSFRFRDFRQLRQGVEEAFVEGNGGFLAPGVNNAALEDQLRRKTLAGR